MVPIAGPVFSWQADKLRGFMDALGIARAHLVNQSSAAAWPSASPPTPTGSPA
jgi:hypothetical protein